MVNGEIWLLGYLVTWLLIGWHWPCFKRRIMSVQTEQLKQRTMRFALDVLHLVDTFPITTSAQLVGRQLSKAATSVAANYRATCVARSRAEFVAKLGVIFEEADESEFWLDIAVRKPLSEPNTSERLHNESIELRAIFGRSLATARLNRLNRNSPNSSIPPITR
jgi:four helix bundle protein